MVPRILGGGPQDTRGGTQDTRGGTQGTRGGSGGTPTHPKPVPAMLTDQMVGMAPDALAGPLGLRSWPPPVDGIQFLATDRLNFLRMQSFINKVETRFETDLLATTVLVDDFLMYSGAVRPRGGAVCTACKRPTQGRGVSRCGRDVPSWAIFLFGIRESKARMGQTRQAPPPPPRNNTPHFIAWV